MGEAATTSGNISETVEKVVSETIAAVSSGVRAVGDGKSEL